MLERKVALSLVAAGAALMPGWPALAQTAAAYSRGPATLRQDAVLSGVLAVTSQLRRLGKNPVNIFDLDATLFETGSRHKAILTEFARDNSRRYPGIPEKVAALPADALPYEVSELFPRLGIDTPDGRKQAREYWSTRFFAGPYLAHDRPIAGSVTYINLLRKAGSVIVYLTGRNANEVRSATLEALAAHGFPVAPGDAVLIMNPQKGLKDSKFKGSPEVRDQIARLGRVVGIFDNEPGNVNALRQSFPEALTVFVDTNHSPGAPSVDTGIPWIKHFLLEWPR